MVAGFGIGAMVFNPIITKFINPDNITPSLAPYPDKPSEKYVVVVVGLMSLLYNIYVNLVKTFKF